MKNILIVEDDVILNNGLAFNFQMDGYHVLSAETLIDARRLLSDQLDIIILDVNLPDGNGFDFCREVRERFDMPILILTACDLEFDMMTGFRAGADDYVTKPFSVNILRERVMALLRRYERKISPITTLKVDGFEVEQHLMQVKKNGVSIDLAPTEYKLFIALVEARGKVLTRQMLLELLWEKDYFVEEHALTVNINRLRNKVEDNPSKPLYIKTVYGKGYTWGEPMYE